jgi:hypothetical protein
MESASRSVSFTSRHHDSWPDAEAVSLRGVINELRAQNERLQLLVAELLIKNQHLRRNCSTGK